jgi:hypothetical protein
MRPEDGSKCGASQLFVRAMGFTSLDRRQPGWKTSRCSIQTKCAATSPLATSWGSHGWIHERTPSWDFSAATLGIIRELGLRYDSSLMADDEPYVILADGEPTGVVEIPVEWIRDDAPYFSMDRYTAVRPYTPPRGVLIIWRDEFDRATHAAIAEYVVTSAAASGGLLTPGPVLA